MRVVTFALTIALCLMQGEAQPSQPRPDTHNAKDVKQPKSEPPLITITVVQQDESQAQEKRADAPPKSYFSRLFSPENIPNILLFVVGATGISVAIKSLKAIHGQRRTMVGQLRMMQKQNREIRRQAAEMERQTAHLAGSVDAARKSADAAERSAKAAMGVAVPTLRIDDFQLVGDWRNANTLQCPRVNIVVKNYGQTPAFLIGLFVAFVVGDEEPDYKSYTIHPTSVVAPNGTATLQAGGLPHSVRIASEKASAIRDHSDSFSVSGRLTYRDIFDSPQRQLVFWKSLLNFFQDGSVDWAGQEHNEYKEKQSQPPKPN